MILISGATGSNGRELVQVLSARGVAIRAMTRGQATDDVLKAPNVTLVKADFDEPHSLAAALADIERAFLLTNSTERAQTQQIAFVDAARRAGVKHIVKLSQYAAEENSPVRFLRYHAAVERHIEQSGMAYTFLRPNLFMQGLLAFKDSIKAQGRFFAAAGDAAVSVVDVRDIAQVAACALTESGHEGKTYTLTGPQALTHAQMAEHFSRQLGRKIEFVDTSPDAMRGALLEMHMPPWQADGLIEDYAHYRRGEAAAVSNDIESATGRAARGFAAFAADYAKELA